MVGKIKQTCQRFSGRFPSHVSKRYKVKVCWVPPWKIMVRIQCTAVSTIYFWAESKNFVLAVSRTCPYLIAGYVKSAPLPPWVEHLFSLCLQKWEHSMFPVEHFFFFLSFFFNSCSHPAFGVILSRLNQRMSLLHINIIVNKTWTVMLSNLLHFENCIYGTLLQDR